jgi:hypothetical protein
MKAFAVGAEVSIYGLRAGFNAGRVFFIPPWRKEWKLRRGMVVG